MKKNIYYRTVLKRENRMKNMIIDYFLGMCSYPRLFLEVTIRDQFGCQYFYLVTALVVGAVVALIPLFITMPGVFIHLGTRSIDPRDFLLHYGTWYVYLAIFLKESFRHHRYVSKARKYIDFNRFSRSSGISLIAPDKTDLRKVEIYGEPMLFFIVGILLAICLQPLGLLFIVCAVIYSGSYMAQYNEGDTFLRDKIDEKIANEELESIFIENKKPEDTRGFNLRMRRPGRKELREELLPSFFEDNDHISEVV